MEERILAFLAESERARPAPTADQITLGVTFAAIVAALGPPRRTVRLALAHLVRDGRVICAVSGEYLLPGEASLRMAHWSDTICSAE